MNEILLTVITAIVSSAASGWAGWFFARRKYNVDVEGGQLENLQKRVEVVNSVVDTLKQELDRLNIENKRLNKENDLMDQKITNLTTIILNHGININKELHEIEDELNDNVG